MINFVYSLISAMKANKQIQMLLSCAVILFLGSCKARFYSPDRQPVPLYGKAGDVYLDASTNLVSKVDLTAGIAPVKHVGTYAGWGFSQISVGDDSTSSSEKRTYRGEISNFGIGLFLSRDQSSRFRFELYGDFAFGTFKNTAKPESNGHFNGKFTRSGILANIGYNSTDNALCIAYSLRAGNLRFHSEDIVNNGYWNYDVTRYARITSYTMLEHALVLRAGGNTTKFQFQIGMSHAVNSESLDNSVPPLKLTGAIGIVFTPNLYGSGR